MSTPQERAYEGVSIATAPLRAAKSLMQTVIILLGLIAFGVGYPLYLLVMPGEHVTAGSIVGSLLTIMTLVTFFYTPYYVIFGSVILFVAGCLWGAFAEDQLFGALSGWGFAILVFSFLAFGILQRYIRHRISDPPPDTRTPAEKFYAIANAGLIPESAVSRDPPLTPRTQTFDPDDDDDLPIDQRLPPDTIRDIKGGLDRIIDDGDRLVEDLDRLSLRLHSLTPEQGEAMITLYGDDPFSWPESAWPK